MVSEDGSSIVKVSFEEEDLRFMVAGSRGRLGSLSDGVAVF